MDLLDMGWLQTFNWFLKPALCAECSRVKHNETKCNEMRRACGCTDAKLLRTHSQVIRGKGTEPGEPIRRLPDALTLSWGTPRLPSSLSKDRAAGCVCNVSAWRSPLKIQHPEILRAWSHKHLLLESESQSEVAQSCLTLSDPMDCSLPGSSAHGIFQARVLEWGAVS